MCDFRLLVLLRLSVGPIPSFIRGSRLRTFSTLYTWVRVTIGVAHAKRNIALARTFNEFLLGLKCFVIRISSASHVFGLRW